MVGIHAVHGIANPAESVGATECSVGNCYLHGSIYNVDALFMPRAVTAWTYQFPVQSRDGEAVTQSCSGDDLYWLTPPPEAMLTSESR